MASITQQLPDPAAPFEQKADPIEGLVQLDVTGMDMVKRDAHEACEAILFYGVLHTRVTGAQ